MTTRYLRTFDKKGIVAMGNGIGVVTFFAFCAPLLIGILYLFVKQEHLKSLNVLLVASAFLCSLYFVGAGKNELNTGWFFFHEPITFNFSSTPNIIFLIVILALGAKFIKESASPINAFFMRFHGVLFSIALSFGFIAFFSGQFMVRYVALEIVGLMAALTPLNSVSDLQAYTRFGAIFLILRLGDVFLWSSILILQNHANTLNISQMMTSAIGLPAESKPWVLIGFMVAVLIKTAVLPFGVWLQFIQKDKRDMVNWLSDILMPSLGYYLLYRVLPLIQSRTLFINVLAVVVLLGSLILMLADLSGWLKIDKRNIYLSLISGMAIYLSALTTPTIFSVYLCLIIILRTRTILKVNNNAWFVRIIDTASIFLLNITFVFLFWLNQPVSIIIGWLTLTGLMILWYWFSPKESQVHCVKPQTHWLVSQFPKSFYKANAWFAQRVETNFINKAFPAFRQIITQSADSTQHFLERGLEKLWDFCVNSMIRISEGTLNNIENRLEQLWEGSGRNMVKLSESTLVQIEDGGSKTTTSLIQRLLAKLGEQDRREQFKSFRWDLIWIPIFLMVILFFLLTS